MTTKIYGIKNCDTMKKAFKWLDEHNVEYEFHDYKKHGLSDDLAQKWTAELPLDQLINKRGTTWRKLDDSVKQSLTQESAKSIITEHTSAVKRPLLDVDGKLYLGFKPEQYQEIFN